MSTGLLAFITIEATKIIVPILIFVGTISNSLNIVILTRPSLIHHSCSLYFLSLAIVNLFYCAVILTINLISDGYSINIHIYSIFSCKLLNYLLNLCPNLSVYFIVLASIDRYCSSSMNVNIRRWSNVRIARRLILCITSILTIYMLSVFFAFDLDHNIFITCMVHVEDLWKKLVVILNIFFYVILAPFCMIVFGFLTIQNVKRFEINRERISRYRRTETQLSRMLLIQTSSHVLFSLPFCIVFFIVILPIPFRTTSEYYYIFVLCKIPFYFTFAINFFLYILSGSIYRKELIMLFKKIFSFHPNNRVRPINSTNL